jgi:hypothetical protein
MQVVPWQQVHFFILGIADDELDDEAELLELADE